MPVLTVRSIAIAVALVTTTVAGAAAPEAGARLALVDAATAAALGFEVVDAYGAFVSVHVTPRDEARAVAAGGVIKAVAAGVARGGHTVGDAVPDDLRAAPDTAYHVVVFRGPVHAAWRDALDREAAAVYDYLPHHAFLVRAPTAGAAQLKALPGVAHVEPYHPAFKLSAELPEAGLVAATALAYRDANLDHVLAALDAAGATPTAWASHRLEHVIDVTVDASDLAAVARIEDVAWVEPAFDDGGLDNVAASAVTQSGDVGAFSVHDHGVDGSSQKVAVCDTGVNTQVIGTAIGGGPQVIRMTHEMHDSATQSSALLYNAHLFNPPPSLYPHANVDLYFSPQENGNRGDADDTDGHGTHTAGTIAGNRAPYDVRDGDDGVAFAARLVICDIHSTFQFHILNDYENYWDPAFDAGARVHSNSWGSAHTNSYTTKARQHDAYVWDHRDFVILRSMGNTGAHGSMRPEAAAKSALGIGATDNGAGKDDIASFSTGGSPTDGRIKPNVVAPGACLTSSHLFTATSYACLAGTSMSTPAVAGAAALVRDYFAKGHYPSGAATPADAMDPSAALVRAILQISGREISDDRGRSGFPNDVQGWGRVTLDDALYFAGDATGFIAIDEGTALATGETWTTDVTVAAGAPLRIMLAWSDAAAASGANPALVNDLDLTVTGPDGVRVGNAFVGNEVPAGSAGADAVNVEEAVYVTAPTAGTYTITVTGANVPAGPQPFALVVTGDVA